MLQPTGPAYGRSFVRERMATGRYRIPVRVKRHIRSRGWDEAFVVECVSALDSTGFHKSVPHSARPGVWLDVYRPWFRGERMYVKLTVYEDAEDLLILSFCIDGSAH